MQSLAGLQGCAGLALLDERWRRWGELADRVVAEVLPGDAELPAAALLPSLLLAAAADPATAQRLAQRARRLATRRNRRVPWFRWLVDHAEGDDAPVYHAVMVLASALLDERNHRTSPQGRERARRLINEDLPRAAQLAQERSRRSARQLRRASPVLAAGLGYLGLVAVAGLGVAFGTSPVQGVLTAVVLLAAGVCLYIGMSRPQHRLADALLTSWAGAWVGLFLAVLFGVAVGLLVGPESGWPTFWTTWIVTVAAGAALGGVR